MKGFTLIELLVVIGLLAIIALATVPFLFDSIGRTELQATTWDVVDTLRRAQSQAVAGKGNSAWSVHFEAQQMVIFDGSVYSGADPDNVAIAVSNSVTISGISLNGAGVNVTFSARKGETTQYGTITISDDNSTQTSVVTINQHGLIY